MCNFSVKKILEIAERYFYVVEIIRVGRDSACLRISNSFYKSPYPRYLDSDVCSYSYVKRLFDSLDIRFKI